MKKLTPTSEELEAILVWEREFHSLEPEQQSLCVAMQRHPGPVPADELAAYCESSPEHLKRLKKGIYGLLIDDSTGHFWIR